MEYEYFDQTEQKSKRLGKGWRRVDIWREMEFEKWLEWLDGGLVQPELERDWLGEMVAEPIPKAFALLFSLIKILILHR